VFHLVDRYISKAFLTYFFAGLVVFLTLFFVIDFMTQITRFDVTLATLGRYYGAYCFEIIYQFIPVAAMVGVVFTLSTLNKSRELTALFSLGMSLFRVLVPIFFWISLFVGLSFYIGDQVVPVTKKKKDYIYFVEMKKNPSLYSTVRNDRIWYRTDNILFNIKHVDAEKKIAYGLTFNYMSPDWKLQQMITSKEAEITNEGWILKDGTLTLFVDDMGTPLVQSFDSKTVAMTEELSDIQTTSSASDFLSFRQLGRYIAKNKEAGLNMTAFEVDYHNKLSFPFTIFVMALLGVPFVITHQRSGGMAKNVGLILLMTFSFWVLQSSSMSLGRHGQLPPIVATWGPNVLIMIATYFCFRWTRA
jgi:lipopolysaccharide export system permease protein